MKFFLTASFIFILATSLGQPVSLRKLHADSWVATDALGRSLPAYEQCGPVKKDRFVGMFYFKKDSYKELWFNWKGKPLLLFGQHEIPSRKLNNDVVFADDIRSFFSIRQSWAWTSLPWYQSFPYGKDKWPWVDHYPQAIGWHEEQRNSEGQSGAGPYINNAGRNDIAMLKVAYDAASVYFYAETVKPLTSAKDRNWMLLFIDTDQNKKTGWQGYEVVINTSIKSATTTTWAYLNSDGRVGKRGAILYTTSQNKLMIQMPRTYLNSHSTLAFDFHWADNIGQIGDITEFFLNGDNAPERRANYRFQKG
jgi:hypothetical protein